jgi:hypothetical protein
MALLLSPFEGPGARAAGSSGEGSSAPVPEGRTRRLHPAVRNVQRSGPAHDSQPILQAPPRNGYESALQRLQTIPGMSRRTAEVLLAEIGADLSRFPSAWHLAFWAGLCPGNDESAGKRRSGRTRKGSPWLRSALVEAARAAARTKDAYLAAQYRRLAARRGAKRAAVAVAHSLLVIVYVLLTRQQEGYQDLGTNSFDERGRQAVLAPPGAAMLGEMPARSVRPG